MIFPNSKLTTIPQGTCPDGVTNYRTPIPLARIYPPPPPPQFVYFFTNGVSINGIKSLGPVQRTNEEVKGENLLSDKSYKNSPEVSNTLKISKVYNWF